MSSPRRTNTRKDAWKVKSLRSTFGPQCLGHIPTSPASGFGSGLRDSSGKMYVSIAMDRARARSQGGNNSPGPIYQNLPAVGPQRLSTLTSAPVPGFPRAKRQDMSVKTGIPGPGSYQVKSVEGGLVPAGSSASATFDSTKTNMPSVRFGNALRDSQQLVFISKEHDKTSGGRDSPGPSAYNTGSLVGSPSNLSTQATVRAPKIGTNPRFKNPGEGSTKGDVPGPGQYSNSPLGVESHITKLPSVGFAKAHRDANRKIFISLEHEKAAYGEASPGPATAVSVASVGKQLVSKAKTAPNWSFGTGKRPPLAVSDCPGPGEYYA